MNDDLRRMWRWAALGTVVVIALALTLMAVAT